MPWCSAPISAAPSTRLSKEPAAIPVKLRIAARQPCDADRRRGPRATVPRPASPLGCRHSSRRRAGLPRISTPPSISPFAAPLHRRSSRTVARLLVRLLPAKPASDDPARPLYLDTHAIGTPAVALANAARETLRMADVVEKMLAGTQAAFHGDDRHLVAETSRTRRHRRPAAPRDPGAISPRSRASP